MIAKVGAVIEVMEVLTEVAVAAGMAGGIPLHHHHFLQRPGHEALAQTTLPGDGLR